MALVTGLAVGPALGGSARAGEVEPPSPSTPAAAEDVAQTGPAPEPNPETRPEPAPDPGMEPGVLPAAAAIVPGALVHGVGHFVAGDSETGWTLLGAQGVGLGLIAVAGVPLAATGASRKIIGPTTALAITGVGLLFGPMLPDVYGALTGGRDARAPAPVPLTARLGYAWVYDPQFDYAHFATVGYDLRLSDFVLAGSAWIAADDDNQRLQQAFDWRLWGEASQRAAHDGWIDLDTAVAWHRFGSEGFSRLSTEVAGELRYPLGRVSRSLRGSFADWRLGYALEFYDYDVPGLSFGEDVAEQLLIRFGWGFWFADRGSLALYYDHRKDDHAGGFSATGLGGGIPGYVGLAADYALDDTWALDLDVRRGAAWIVGLGLRYRYGAR